MAQITTTLRRLFNELAAAERVTHDPRVGQSATATRTHVQPTRLDGAAAAAATRTR